MTRTIYADSTLVVHDYQEIRGVTSAAALDGRGQIQLVRVTGDLVLRDIAVQNAKNSVYSANALLPAATWSSSSLPECRGCGPSSITVMSTATVTGTTATVTTARAESPAVRGLHASGPAASTPSGCNPGYPVRPYQNFRLLVPFAFWVQPFTQRFS